MKFKSAFLAIIFSVLIFAGCGEEQKPETKDNNINIHNIDDPEAAKLIKAQEMMIEWVKTEEAMEIIKMGIENPGSNISDSLMNEKMLGIIQECGIKDEKQAENLYMRFKDHEVVKFMVGEFEHTMDSLIIAAVKPDTAK